MERPLEHCCLCDDLTGRAGRADDSLYLETPTAELGPLCEACWGALRRDDLEDRIADLEAHLASESFTKCILACSPDHTLRQIGAEHLVKT